MLFIGYENSRFCFEPGRYRKLHHIGFALGIHALGLFTRLNRNSKIAEWVVYQMIAGLGAGMVLYTLLPAFQAALSEGDQASATASWAFIRSYGNIWSVAIPAAIFKTQVESLSYRLNNSTVRGLLSRGHAYEHATAAFVNSYHGDLRPRSSASSPMRLNWYGRLRLHSQALHFASSSWRERSRWEKSWILNLA